MKRIVLFLLLYAGITNAQVISFPDANLKAALLAPASAEDTGGAAMTTVDADSDGEIDVAEAMQVARLNIDSANISDLTGIENFQNLKELYCNGNQIATLNLAGSGMNALEHIYIANNLLTYIDVSGLTGLFGVAFTGNAALSHIDVSGCTVFGTINYPDNGLTYLDVSNSGTFSVNSMSANLNFINFEGCANLNDITIWNSQLTGLNIHDLTNLTSITLFGNPALGNITVTSCPLVNYLFTANNNITALDVSTMPALVFLYCPDNQLTTLDVSLLTQLDELVLDHNPLETLFMKNGRNESTVSLDGCTSLTFVCADEGQIGDVQNVLNTAGITAAVCNSYCNFTPGGAFNTITGNFKLDSNANGCDAGDANPIYMRVDATDGTNTQTSFTNANGVYTLYAQAGSFTLTPSVENPSYFAFSPATDMVAFPDINFNTEVRNFCVTTVGNHQDLEVVVAPVMPARPGFTATYSIVYKNKGNQVISQANGLNFTYNASQLDFISASTATSSGTPGSLTWDFADLLPFESREITVTMHVHAPTDANPVNAGDVLQLAAAIQPATDENSTDNNYQFNQTVVGSFDPNDITCVEGSVVAPSQIGEYLHYVINFENTGTYPAENIVVRVPIDQSRFDLASLQLLQASDPVQARLTGNIAEFIFENVQLELGGHGHILLKIKTNSGLAQGDIVSKRADIFFDYNFPVDTGFADTAFAVLHTQDFDGGASIVMHPNPTTGIFRIQASTAISSIQVYDVQGRLLYTHIGAGMESDVDISRYPKGIYLVKIATGNGSRTEKIIRK